MSSDNRSSEGDKGRASDNRSPFEGSSSLSSSVSSSVVSAAALALAASNTDHETMNDNYLPVSQATAITTTPALGSSQTLSAPWQTGSGRSLSRPRVSVTHPPTEAHAVTAPHAAAAPQARRRPSKVSGSVRAINHAGILALATTTTTTEDHHHAFAGIESDNDGDGCNNSATFREYEYAARRTQPIRGQNKGIKNFQFESKGELRRLRSRSQFQSKAAIPNAERNLDEYENENENENGHPEGYDGRNQRHSSKSGDDNETRCCRSCAGTVRSMVLGMRHGIGGSPREEEEEGKSRKHRKVPVPTLILHATRFLRGDEPYTIRFRIKTVHGLWLASLWCALATDAFAWATQSSSSSLSSSWERVWAWLNLVVWTVLLLELMMETFVRPDRWQWLIRSEDAWSPSTARYLGGIHLFVESVSLACWLPEVWCLLVRAEANAGSVSGWCLDRSCGKALECWGPSLTSVVGPTVGRALLGRVWYGVRRFRVFGLVRHWRNAWLERAFGKHQQPSKHEVFGDPNPAPYQHRQYHSPQSVRAIDYGGDRAEEDPDPFQRERHESSSRALLSPGNHETQNRAKASHVETALMTVNSHRTLFIFCCLTAFFPMIFLLDQDTVVNSSAQQLVEFLQAINVQSGGDQLLGDETNTISTSTSATINTEIGCEFLFDSVEAWTKTLSVRFRPHDFSSDASLSRYLIGLAIRPARCAEQFQNTTIGALTFTVGEECPEWAWPSETEQGNSRVPNPGCILGTSVDRLWNTSVSAGSIATYRDSDHNNETWGVSASYDESETMANSAKYSLILQLLLLTLIIAHLKLMRRDTIKLVLRSLRSMLRIVERYATNPLVPVVHPRNGANSNEYTGSYDSDDTDEDGRSDEDDSLVGRRESGNRDDNDDYYYDDDNQNLGSTYETEQLVTAVSKIADLLRKCWGVAGADIISTNLAVHNGDLNVFNPTVPGKNVFALFAFAKIKDFDHALKRLGGDIMILINDVAVVVHGDVYRWALGDSGQCNKNLGASFFIVFKIGFVREVIEKLEEATRVVFSTANGTKKIRGNHRKSSSSSLQRLSSAEIDRNSSMHRPSNYGRKSRSRSQAAPSFVRGLQRKLHGETDVAMKAMAEATKLPLKQIPGISAFADRAVIAMLKSFAGIHRDTQLRAWSRDFRLRGGVGGTWSVDMIFGMDAGWAVEGAVGSEYKIDATYLSPHVNMASRMMSACKQYGVTILVSQAVQELLSEPGKNKLRNLDRVTVKGSSTIQKIYTYDARSKGANFFLNSVSDEQADHQAMNYEPNVWNDDPDLKTMRRHITADFETEFQKGMKHYYEGDWPTAIQHLEKANEIMVHTALAEGDGHDMFRGGEKATSHSDRDAVYFNNETSDPPCQYLINFMRSNGSKAPRDWGGWHPLMSK